MIEERRHNDDVIITELRALKEILMLKVSNTENEIKILKEQIEKSNEKIRIIELWQSNSIGKLTIISIIVGIGVTTFTAWITGHLK